MSVSVVIPCLNEEGSIKECIRLVQEAFVNEKQLEIVVADNGSTDRSRELAINAGAKVVDERRQGYGSAILRGLRESGGDYIIVGDADNTYDFRDAALMVEELKKGAEFVIGDRIHGKIDRGAMPWLHQHFGTPLLTWVLNQFFGCRVHDINCGLRAFRRDCIEKMRLRSPGMEFASEMVIHAQKAGLTFAEIPIRYYRRHHGQAKLRTFRDGWRHLRFILLCAPFPLYFFPAAVAALLSGYLYTESRLGFQVMASLLTIASFQVLIFGVMAKTYLWVADSFLVDRRFGRFIGKFRLEYGILAALVLCLLGVIFVHEFDIRNLIRGSALLALSLQVFFSSFLLSTMMFKKQDTI